MDRLPSHAIDRIATELPADHQIDSRYWSTSRAASHSSDKTNMAKDFVDHYFLVPNNSDNPVDLRNTVASLIVSPGTTPREVVQAALEWIQKQHDKTYFLTWYSPGSLVPALLKDFRESRHLSTPVKLVLFPGEVDFETESVSGEDAEAFAEHLTRHFTYALLSAYTIDLASGDMLFFFKREKRLQELVATRPATHKFVFLDPSKFMPEGEPAYNVADLLATSCSVTIVTVQSASTSRIKADFATLAQKLIPVESSAGAIGKGESLLRLRIVGHPGDKTECIERRGHLAPPRPLDQRRPMSRRRSMLAR